MKDWKNSCDQCSQMIECLLKEIEQLETKERQLKKLNHTLIESLRDEEDKQNVIDWKAKYEEEVKRSHQLEKRMMQKTLTDKFDATMSQKSLNNSLRNSRQSNLKKMDELIDTMVKRKNFLEPPQSVFPAMRRRISSTKKSSKEIVIRLVDGKAYC